MPTEKDRDTLTAPILVIIPRQGNCSEVRSISRQEVLERIERGEDVVHPCLTEAQVRACYEGHALVRAHAIAKLTRAQLCALYGPSTQYLRDGTSTYNSATLLRRIGRTIVDHCPVHQTHNEECERCGRHKWACNELRHCGLGLLRLAAHHKDPELQVCAVLDGHLARGHAPGQRRSRQKLKRAQSQVAAR